MDDTSKYLIHAAITADGVVERSDVVGAIFGQTEGLLGDELDLRELQQASKVGRIDVEIESEEGQSFGHITIATSLDRVETSILAASLETITRVGPCRSEIRITDIEDVREAKRREVVERAKELLAEAFDEGVMTSSEILAEVRESVRVEDITEYEGLPAGPNVADSDAIVVVEGRSDVLTLLKYGIKNAIAVEGTNVPDAVADLTQRRTVTAFLDGDRGGELILRELVQVGNVDYVAFAPESQSVEDLDRSAVLSALRDKVPYETFAATDAPGGVTGESPPTPDAEGSGAPATDRESDADSTADATAGSDADGGEEADRSAASGTEAVAETDGAGAAVTGGGDGSAATADGDDGPRPGAGADADTAGGAERDADTAGGAERDDDETGASTATDAGESGSETGETGETGAANGAGGSETAGTDESRGDADGGEGAGGSADADADDTVGTLRGVAREVIEAGTGRVRLTDDAFRTVESGDAAEAFDRLKDAEEAPYAVFVDGEVTQRLLDVAAQRGTDHVVGRSLGEFVKRPVSVRIRTAEQLLGPRAAGE
jgi:hypothetical protein